MPAELVYFDVVQPLVQVVQTNDESGHTPEVHTVSAIVTFTPSITEVQSADLGATVMLRPITGRIVNGELKAIDGTPGIELLANTTELGIDGPLTYRVDYSRVVFDGGNRAISSFRFQAPTEATTIDLNTVARLEL